MGRMALTNYLTQTVIMSLIFYGYGFGLFGAFTRVQLYLIVFAIWALQLWYSPIWLARYRFGPVEWGVEVADLRGAAAVDRAGGGKGELKAS